MSKKLEKPPKIELASNVKPESSGVSDVRAFSCQNFSEFLCKTFLSIRVLPPAPHVEELTECEPVSEKEARDLVARSVVGELMKSFPEMRRFGGEVAKFKKYVLNDKELSIGLMEGDGGSFRDVLISKFT